MATTKKAAAKAPAKTASSASSSKTEKPVENLVQLLGEAERTIKELSIRLAECEPGKHLGVKGMPKPTSQQIAIQRQIDAAQKRYEAVMKLLVRRQLL